MGLRQNTVCKVLINKGLQSLGVGEVGAEPIKNRRQKKLLWRDFVFRFVQQEVLRLLFQLKLQVPGDEGLVPQFRAAFRSTIDGKMNAWLIELLAQNFMFDGVQIEIDAAKLEKFDVPGRIDEWHVSPQIFDALHRVIVEDELNGEGVVGIYPVGQLLPFAPITAVRWVLRKQFQIFPEKRAVRPDASIVYPAIGRNMAGGQGAPIAMRNGMGVERIESLPVDFFVGNFFHARKAAEDGIVHIDTKKLHSDESSHEEK